MATGPDLAAGQGMALLGESRAIRLQRFPDELVPVATQARPQPDPITVDLRHFIQGWESAHQPGHYFALWNFVHGFLSVGLVNVL